MRIDPAQLCHAADLADLHARCFRENWNAQVFQDWLRDENTVVLLAQTTELSVSGVVVVRFAADEAEVLTLCVAPENRRAGIGMALMQAARTSAIERGVEAMFLEVDAGNAAALGLYRALNFAEVGQRRDYYRNCESFADAIVLRRALTDGN